MNVKSENEGGYFMTQKVKRGLISIVMAVALVISVLAGVLPVQSIKAAGSARTYLPKWGKMNS